jgi:hypothetical protein
MDRTLRRTFFATHGTATLPMAARIELVFVCVVINIFIIFFFK